MIHANGDTSVVVVGWTHIEASDGSQCSLQMYFRQCVCVCVPHFDIDLNQSQPATTQRWKCFPSIYDEALLLCISNGLFIQLIFIFQHCKYLRVHSLISQLLYVVCRFKARRAGGCWEGGWELILWTGDASSGRWPLGDLWGQGLPVFNVGWWWEPEAEGLGGHGGVEPSADPVCHHGPAHALATQVMHGWMMNQD